jgi:hypothetical protein
VVAILVNFGGTMKKFLISATMSLAASSAFAAKIDLIKTELPWRNAQTAGATYKMGAKPNTVHVIEAYSISCSWCNSNASQVQELASALAGETRIQFLDLGLDARPADYTRWISAHKPTYPVVQDVGQVVWNQLKQDNGIPQTFIVDCRGELVGSTIGYWGDVEKNTLQAAIAKALEISCE